MAQRAEKRALFNSSSFVFVPFILNNRELDGMQVGKQSKADDDILERIPLGLWLLLIFRK